MPCAMTMVSVRNWGSWSVFVSRALFQVGDIAVKPFTIPHDAADPVGFTFRAEGIKVGVATDLGYIPVSVRDHLRGCDVLIMESNHDLEMLRVGPYPWSVKQRVMSRVGIYPTSPRGFLHQRL